MFPVPLTSSIPLFSAASDLCLHFCIGLSVPILRFYFLYMQVSYAGLTKKNLYNLTHISVFFSDLYPPRDVTVTSTRFLHAGQGDVTVASSGYLRLYFCNLYWKCERPRIVCRRLVAYHCNFGKYFKRTRE